MAGAGQYEGGPERLSVRGGQVRMLPLQSKPVRRSQVSRFGLNGHEFFGCGSRWAIMHDTRKC